MQRYLATLLLLALALNACGAEVVDRSSVVPPVTGHAASPPAPAAEDPEASAPAALGAAASASAAPTVARPAAGTATAGTPPAGTPQATAQEPGAALPPLLTPAPRVATPRPAAATPPPAPALPTAAPVAGATAIGAGVVIAGGDSVSFNFDVQDVVPPGDLVVDGYVGGAALRLRGDVTAVTIGAGQVIVAGTCTYNGAPASFSAQATDSPGAFSLAVATATGDVAISGSLSRGAITITPRP